VFPRLCGRLSLEVPMAAELWGDTMIEIPQKLAGGLWSNLLDGSSVEAVMLGRRRALRISDVLRHFPVALLASRPAGSAAPA
jgi:maltooligosyltrehalose synthase